MKQNTYEFLEPHFPIFRSSHLQVRGQEKEEDILNYISNKAPMKDDYHDGVSMSVEFARSKITLSYIGAR
jgi:hypothetical protein